MKKLLIFPILLAGLILPVSAQGVTMTGKSSSKVVLNWVLPAPITGVWLGCVAGQPNCTFLPYELPGSCPTPLIGSTGWNALASTGTNATTATDLAPSPNASGQASYVVKTSQNGLTSDPSNCVTVTIPNVPSPATALTATQS